MEALFWFLGFILGFALVVGTVAFGITVWVFLRILNEVKRR